MTLTVQTSTDGAVLTVTGELDSSNAYDLYLAAVEQAQSGRTSVVVDLSSVTFIDSTGLGMLVRSHNELRNDHSARFALRDPSPRVVELLRITALSGEFDYA